jgi:hypothetical protein
MDAREKRLAQNEALYREVNERIQALANRPDHAAAPPEYDYFCECANADCTLQVRVRRDIYEWVRAEPNRFLIAPGHDTPEVEAIVREENGFSVVEKQGDAARYVEHLDPRGRG